MRNIWQNIYIRFRIVAHIHVTRAMYRREENRWEGICPGGKNDWREYFPGVKNDRREYVRKEFCSYPVNKHCCLFERFLSMNFGEHFMPKQFTLRQRIYTSPYVNESYIHSVRLTFISNEENDINSSVFREQRKRQKTTVCTWRSALVSWTMHPSHVNLGIFHYYIIFICLLKLECVINGCSVFVVR